MKRYAFTFIVVVTIPVVRAGEPPSYAKQVRPIFAKYCLECHNTKSAKGGLDLETHKGMLDGSDNGPVLKLGKADESVLIQSIEGKTQSLMPPKSKTLRPTKAEIAMLRAWVTAGAKDDSAAIKVAIPEIKAKTTTRPPVKALVYFGELSVVIAARHRQWEYLAASPGVTIMEDPIVSGTPISGLAEHRNGRLLAFALGQPGQAGQVELHDSMLAMGQLRTSTQKLNPAHTDLILDLAFSPDGKTLVTCSYDTQVKLWDVATAKLLHTLKDHSDSVYGLAFHPQGKMLATCAADRTVKIWNPATAKLLFTFSESTDWTYTVAWRPNGKHVAAGGVDKSIRVWEMSDKGGRVVHAVFAHEGAVTKLIYSKDGQTLYSLGEDRIVKAWDAERMVERKTYERQPETVLCMALSPNQKQLALGRYDGQVVLLDIETGKAQTVALADRPFSPGSQNRAVPAALASIQKPAPKPEAKSITPSEGRRGQPLRVAIDGNHLDHANELVVSAPGASARILYKSETKIAAEISFPPTTSASVQQIQVKSDAGVSTPLSFTVDPFPSVPVREGNDSPGQAQAIPLPATLAGKLDKTGDLDFFKFEVKAGQQVGVQILTAAVGSKVEPTLQLTDLRGKVFAESNDGHLGHTFAEAGVYVLGVRDREFRGGAGMHYRLHVGEIPVVTAVFPLGAQRGVETDVRIDGVFLASQSAKVKVPADAAPGSKIAVPVTSKHGTPLGNATIVAGEFPEVRLEQTSIPVPGTGDGVLRAFGQNDVWRFEAKKGQRLIIETQAQRIGSALDSVLEVLDAKGNSVPRAVLRCQAKTFVTFRDHDNATAGIRIDAWDDLGVNDYIYVGNELMRIKALPGHPDADCNFFASAAGPRTAFLDTTPTHHSQNTPMYKVTIHPPGSKFPPNGFPVFALNYRNDDGGQGYGRDSRIFFDPPADGTYHVRVSDARGQHGPNYGYRLTIRTPRPSFAVRYSPTNPMVWKEGAVPLTISVDRIDDYNGPIKLRFTNVQPGFSVPDTEMQAGETVTAVALYGNPQAPTAPQKLTLVGEAVIDGQKQMKEFVGEAPKLEKPGEIVTFTEESEVTIRPGGEVKVQVHIERRGGFTGRVPLEVKGLPHGVRVLDIGLNGILITEKETRRTIVLHAESWVEPTEHPFLVLAKREGKNSEHAAKSILLRVAK